jgi:hypothetical protein
MSDLYPAILREVREIYEAEVEVLQSCRYLVDGYVPDDVFDTPADRLVAFSDLLDWALPVGINAGFSDEVVLDYMRALLASVEEMCQWWKAAGDLLEDPEAIRELNKRRRRYGEGFHDVDSDAYVRNRLYEELSARYVDVKAKMQPLREMAAAASGLAAMDEELEDQETTAGARHGPEFRSVNWFGTQLSFTGNQAVYVRILWEAWENGTPEVGQDTLLAAADADTQRLDHAFSMGKHPAWGTMIRPGSTKGTFRLSPPDDE